MMLGDILYCFLGNWISPNMADAVAGEK